MLKSTKLKNTLLVGATAILVSCGGQKEIKIDLAVLPETKSQGLFHQIHKQVTFC